MFQIAPGIEIAGYLIFLVIGLTIGAVSGILVSITLKLRVQGLVKDAFIGAVGFIITVIGCAIVPWPQNTITTALWLDRFVRSPVNRYQHPFIAAAIVAVILPALHQFLRFKHIESARE